MPPDVRRGCAPPARCSQIMGLRPWFGLCPKRIGPEAERGAQPRLIANVPARQSLASHQAAKPLRDQTRKAAARSDQESCCEIRPGKPLRDQTREAAAKTDQGSRCEGRPGKPLRKQTREAAAKADQGSCCEGRPGKPLRKQTREAATG